MNNIPQFLLIILCMILSDMLHAEEKSLRSSHYAEIQFLDASTGLGIPLVELETTSGTRFVSDNYGRVAIDEPGYLQQEVFFSAEAHGYEIPKDGFAYQGFKVQLELGKPQVLQLRRINVAERVCRLTGEGRFRDSQLLGYKLPVMEDISPGRVVGQDSIQTAIYQGKIYWFWGDTLFLKHPLGIFRMSGGTTPLVNPQQLQQTPELALKYDYFLDDKGYARNMMPHRDQPEGVIWIESIVVLNDVVFKDRAGSEIMLAHFSRRKGLTGVLEQGLAKFDDEKQEFVLMKTLALDEQWRYPHGHPLVVEHAGQRYFYFGSPHPNVRVKADLESVLDPGEYEALTCLNESGSVLFNSEAQPVWRWQKELKPVSSAMEYDWVQAGTLKVEDALFCPRDVDHPEDLIKLHRGTVHWNQYRQKYIMLAGQLEGKSSMLGEIWFSESAAPEGPFKQAKKVVTHNKQTFYNPCHHVFLDAGLGRTIYFEGTYTHDFSGNPHKTMRYNYNQILYKLDLSKLPL